MPPVKLQQTAEPAAASHQAGFLHAYAAAYSALRRLFSAAGLPPQAASLQAQGRANLQVAALLLQTPSETLQPALRRLLLPVETAAPLRETQAAAELLQGLQAADVRALGPQALALAHEEVVLQRAEPAAGKRRMAGAFYTPAHLARQLCRRALAAHVRPLDPSLEPLALWLEAPLEACELRLDQELHQALTRRLAALSVCDPACGGGAFLAAMFAELRQLAALLELPCSWRELLATLHGVDVDPDAVACCKGRLLLELAATGLDQTELEAAAKLLEGQILCGDSLLEGRSRQWPGFSWRTAFADVLQAGGFDIFAGNPPFLRIQRLAPDVRETLRGLFHTARGKYDAAGLFVEQALAHSAPRGFLALVLPSRLFTAAHGQALRDLLASETGLCWQQDLQDTALFGNSVSYASMVCLQRGNAAAAVKAAAPARHGRNRSRRYLPLAECCSTIFQGCISGADKLFYLQDLAESCSGPQGLLRRVKRRDGGEAFWLEAVVLRPLLMGRDVRRFAQPNPRLLALYPYAPAREQHGKRALPLNETQLAERAPLAWNYLDSLRPELCGRGSASMRYPAWQGYWCPRTPAAFGLPKLLVQTLARRAAFTLDPGEAQGGGYFFSGGGNAGVYGVVPRPEALGCDAATALLYLLALLNAPALEEQVRRNSGLFRGGYVSFGRRYIAPLPVAMPRRGELERLAGLAAAALEQQKADETGPCAVEDEMNSLVAALYT